MNGNVLRTLLRAWLVIAVVDGIFATLLPVVAYGQPLGRVWQGVASTLLGPSAMQGGGRTMLVGLAMHAVVAFAWTTVFIALALLSPALRRLVERPAGMVAVATLYGPAIWMVMSFLVIRGLTGRAPTINHRWWVQLFAHIPFVALPIVAVVGRGLGPIERVTRVQSLGDAT
jgi:hypothetical protein